MDAAEQLLAEHDPLLATFDQVAAAAGVSRALVHTYLGDRRGLIDAVQVRIVSRLDARVTPAVGRATTTDGRLRALVGGVFAHVEAEGDAWGVLAASGGLDHPALHGLRTRWTTVLSLDDRPDDLGAQAAVGALLAGVGSWVNRGVDPQVVATRLGRLLAPDGVLPDAGGGPAPD